MENPHIKHYVHNTAAAFTPLPSNTASETRSAALSVSVTWRRRRGVGGGGANTPIFFPKKIKGKVFPLQARCGPEGG